MHETSALDKVSKFIYALPDFMVSGFYQRDYNLSDLYHNIFQIYILDLCFICQDTIAILHNATTAGVVPVVAELLTSERLCLSRDQYGATPLHKAVLYYQPKLVKLIADKFRIATRAKDQVNVNISIYGLQPDAGMIKEVNDYKHCSKFFFRKEEHPCIIQQLFVTVASFIVIY